MLVFGVVGKFREHWEADQLCKHKKKTENALLIAEPVFDYLDAGFDGDLSEQGDSL